MYECVNKTKFDTWQCMVYEYVNIARCELVIHGNVRIIKFICDKWRVEPQSLQYRWNKERLFVHNQQNFLEVEDVVAMVKELANGIIGFDNEEIKEIFAYVSPS